MFISYSHQDDNEFFERLKQEIEKENIEYWTDEKISPGEVWSKAIDDAIKNAFAVIVVMSPVATKSQYITYEWSFALGLGKVVIPIIVTKGAELHPKLGEIQHIDFTNRQNQPWDRLITRLKAVMNLPQSVPQTLSENNDRLISDLNSKRSDTRRNAIKTLGDLGRRDVIPKLAVLVEDTNEKPSVREDAAITLGKLAAIEATPNLITALRNTKGIMLRKNIMWALGEIGAVEAVSALLELVEWDKETSIKHVAANTLAKIANTSDNDGEIKHIILELEKMLKIQYVWLKEPIVEALTKIDAPEALAVVEEWKNQQQNPPSTT